jgi:hypothetical protein
MFMCAVECIDWYVIECVACCDMMRAATRPSITRCSIYVLGFMVIYSYSYIHKYT